MRAGHALVVLLSLVLCGFLWGGEGEVFLQPSFFIPSTSLALDEDGGLDRVGPKPVVAQLLDGTTILVEAREHTLFFYDTSRVQGSAGGQFLNLPKAFSLDFPERIAGFNVGFVGRAPRTSTNTKEPRYGICVAILEQSYQLHLLDLPPTREALWTMLSTPVDRYELKRWAREAAPTFARVPSLPTASIALLSERIMKEDAGGIVVVTCSVALEGRAALRLYVAFRAEDGEERWRHLASSSSKVDEVIREVSAVEGGGVEPKEGEEGHDVLTVPRVAAGATNEVRPLADASEGIHFRAKKTSPIAKLESPWTKLRETIMTALPHVYRHPWDAELYPHLAYQSRARGAALSGSRGAAAKKNGEEVGRIPTVNGSMPAPGWKKWWITPAGTAAPSQANRRGAVWRSQSKVFHVDGGDGAGGANASAAAQDEAAADESPATRWDSRLLSREQREAYRRQHPPNVLVFHGKEGVEVVHLYAGYGVTRVAPLSEHVFYDDMDENGIIDGAFTRIGLRTHTSGGSSVQTGVDCAGVIASGFPFTRDVRLNISICETSGQALKSAKLLRNFLETSKNSVHDGGREELDRSPGAALSPHADALLSVSPIGLQLNGAPFKPSGFSEPVSALEHRVVFMTSSGLVTCVDPAGQRVAWRESTEATFSCNPDQGGRHCFAHLASFHPHQQNRQDNFRYVGGIERYFRSEPYVLAVGESMMTLLRSLDGEVVQKRIELPHPPVGPVLIVDANNDGINDVVVVTTGGIYGFVGKLPVRSNTSVSGMLISTGILVALLLFTRDFQWLEVFFSHRNRG